MPTTTSGFMLYLGSNPALVHGRQVLFQLSRIPIRDLGFPKLTGCVERLFAGGLSASSEWKSENRVGEVKRVEEAAFQKESW